MPPVIPEFDRKRVHTTFGCEKMRDLEFQDGYFYTSDLKPVPDNPIRAKQMNQFVPPEFQEFVFTGVNAMTEEDFVDFLAEGLEEDLLSPARQLEAYTQTPRNLMFADELDVEDTMPPVMAAMFSQKANHVSPTVLRHGQAGMRRQTTIANNRRRLGGAPQPPG